MELAKHVKKDRDCRWRNSVVKDMSLAKTSPIQRKASSLILVKNKGQLKNSRREDRKVL